MARQMNDDSGTWSRVLTKHTVYIYVYENSLFMRAREASFSREFARSLLARLWTSRAAMGVSENT